MKNNNQIDIPLVFFFCAFCIVIFGLFSKLTSQDKFISVTKPIPSPLQSTPNKNIHISIDYNKPIACHYQTKESSISASLEGSSLSGTFLSGKITTQYVVQGDCLYSWTSNNFNGAKKCGMGSYIPLGKQLLSSGLGSVESIISMVPKSEKSTSIDFQALFVSCKNVKRIDGGIFVVPKEINFK